MAFSHAENRLASVYSEAKPEPEALDYKRLLSVAGYIRKRIMECVWCVNFGFFEVSVKF